MIFERIYENLVNRRNRILNGDLNCIPLPFKRFSADWPGIEQAKYYLITASQKVGKSKLADFLFVYHPLLYLIKHPGKFKLKIFYFTLEMDKDRKYREFICYLLYHQSNGRIRLSHSDLASTRADKPLPEEVLHLLQEEEYQEIFKKFEECVEFIDDIKNPMGILKFCKEYALANGHIVYKTMSFKQPDGTVIQKQVMDRCEPNDPNEYRIIVIDNAANLVTENGNKLMETISALSKHCITLRDIYKFTPVLIQHQAQSQESNENLKLNKLRPTIDGLADCKTTSRDVDMAIGLYTPSRYGINEYKGYDIPLFKDYIRFMEIIAGRDGAGGSTAPLFFDGAVAQFEELPLPQQTPLLASYIQRIKILEGNVASLTRTAILLLGGNKKYTQGNLFQRLSKRFKRMLKIGNSR